jgi:hypothetical protein
MERDWLLLFGHPREKSHPAPMAPVRHAALGRGGNWVCPRSLSVALRFRVVCGRIHSRRRRFADRAELVTINLQTERATY